MKINSLKYSLPLVIMMTFAPWLKAFIAPGGEDIIKQIEEAIQVADAKKLAEFFSSTIDLELENLNGNYSKSQAEIILRDFFKNNPAKSFSINHQGDSKDGSRFFIGTYSTATKSFRVYGLLKNESDKLVLRQLQFDKE